MNLEQMKKIVDGAPEWAVAVNLHNGTYFSELHFAGSVSIAKLRTELAKHEPLDLEPADIPHGTIILEK